MAAHGGLIAVFVLSLVAVTVNAQCDLPSAWTRKWWAGYAVDGDGQNVNTLFAFNVTYHSMYQESDNPSVAEDVSQCETFETIEVETLAGFVRSGSSPAQRFCFQGIGRGEGLMYRHTANEETNTAKTVDQCIDDFGRPNIYSALIKWPFSFVGQTNLNFQLPNGVYQLSYSNGGGIESCSGTSTNPSTMTISGNEITLASCYTGQTTYTRPLNGKLYIVGEFDNYDLDIEQDTIFGGMVILAYPDSTALSGYYFYVARYIINAVEPEEPENLEIFFTTNDMNNPIGYTSKEFMTPDISENNVITFTVSTNECDSLPCKNGGTCVQKFDDYECICATGFSGDDCLDDYNDCEDLMEPCSGHGECEDLLNAYECDCDPGYSGDICDIMDPCWDFPCGLGTCVKMSNVNYTCNCPEDYFGRNCEFTNICSRDEPCQNGGSCFLTPNRDYRCRCPPEWAGKNCEQPFSGTTTRRPPVGPVVCEDDDDCNNGGICEERRCQCSGFWVGPTCDVMSIWFIVSIALIVFLVILLIIVLIVCCCCCMDRGNNQPYDNEYATMKSQSGIMPAPGSVSFNVLSSPTRTYSN